MTKNNLKVKYNQKLYGVTNIYKLAIAEAWYLPLIYISILISRIMSWGPSIDLTKVTTALWGTVFLSLKKSSDVSSVTSLPALTLLTSMEPFINYVDKQGVRGKQRVSQVTNIAWAYDVVNLTTKGRRG